MSALADSHWYSEALGGGAIMFSGRSDENAWRRRSCGVGVRGAGRSSNSACGGAAAGGSAGAACSWPSSVLRKRAASGPSRMLARLPLAIREHLLRQLAIGVSRRPCRVVLEHGHPLHRRLGEPDRLADARAEDPVPEVLLEDLDRLLGVERPRIDHGREDARDVHVRSEE